MFTTLLSGDFYPRPPRGGRPPSGRNTPDTPNFYPRPPRGGRPTSAASRSVLSQFLSTPSARRATCGLAAVQSGADHFYPRPPRGGRRAVVGDVGVAVPISIHALREEGDTILATTLAKTYKISIHALREEGDVGVCRKQCNSQRFLSTPSARRATAFVIFVITPFGIFLSTPSARRATRSEKGEHMEENKFLSTPSARRATAFHTSVGELRRISIHALREEGDMAALPSDLRAVIFLSTPSARRATVSPGNTSST